MNIRFYILRRIALLIPTLLGLSILTFSIARIVPGDPVGLAAGPQATEEIKAALRRELGLDQPLPIQYINYMTGLFRGDWGNRSTRAAQLSATCAPSGPPRSN